MDKERSKLCWELNIEWELLFQRPHLTAREGVSSVQLRLYKRQGMGDIGSQTNSLNPPNGKVHLKVSATPPRISTNDSLVIAPNKDIGIHYLHLLQSTHHQLNCNTLCPADITAFRVPSWEKSPSIPLTTYANSNTPAGGSITPYAKVLDISFWQK
jgi:hypothetical protein